MYYPYIMLKLIFLYNIVNMLKLILSITASFKPYALLLHNYLCGIFSHAYEGTKFTWIVCKTTTKICKWIKIVKYVSQMNAVKFMKIKKYEAYVIRLKRLRWQCNANTTIMPR